MAHDGTGGWRLFPSFTISHSRNPDEAAMTRCGEVGGPWPGPPADRTAGEGGALGELQQRLAERDHLRRTMRRRRRLLTKAERAGAAQAFAQLAVRSRLLRPGRHVAVYLAHGAEADLSKLIEAGTAARCILYAPVIADYRSQRMAFVRFDPGAPLRRNRYGIPEPLSYSHTAVRRLDLVFAPLVAVDERGWRIGSGAGFYDRCFSHLRRGRIWRRPRLIGVGYEFQRVSAVDFAPWDVPLDAVLTEKALYRTAQLQGRLDELLADEVGTGDLRRR